MDVYPLQSAFRYLEAHHSIADLLRGDINVNRLVAGLFIGVREGCGSLLNGGDIPIRPEKRINGRLDGGLGQDVVAQNDELPDVEFGSRGHLCRAGRRGPSHQDCAADHSPREAGQDSRAPTRVPLTLPHILLVDKTKPASPPLQRCSLAKLRSAADGALKRPTGG